MSWTDVFPFFSDEAIDEFEEAATTAEKEEIGSLFAVAKWFNRKPSEHIVASSLFWKPPETADGDFPPLTRELLLSPAKFGVHSRISHPWEHYVLPLIAGARTLAKQRPDITFRVYLANDLEFLVAELAEAGCEVALMESSSLRHNPGAMWRFLALEEECLVTITDSDRASDVIHDVERTELVAEAGLSCWRVPYTWGDDETRNRVPTHYRPILACQFGSAGALPAARLMAAFVWHSRCNSLVSHVTVAGGKQKRIFGVDWPGYGFDEWFLLSAIYPRMASAGVLTFVSWSDQCLGHWFALDIEYCSWASHKSEIMFFETPVEMRKNPDAVSGHHSHAASGRPCGCHPHGVE